jgi:transcriptional regulator with XRE-family HTH domain
MDKKGKKYKDQRKIAGKTLRESAEYFNLSMGQLSDIEHGRRAPSKETLRKIRLFYRVCT